MIRKILHIDLDAFFCAVEEKYDPSLRNVRFAVGGSPEGRGVVSSCSYSAREMGVRSAMPMARALKLCPDLRIVRPRHKLYSQESKKVIDYLRTITDQVEQISIDEAFLDITKTRKSAGELTRQIQNYINNNLKLPCSLGVASNKLVAKIATDYGKSIKPSPDPPNAITIINYGDERKFLSPLPIRSLWGVGPKTEKHLSKIGIVTVGDLANASEEHLSKILGNVGKELIVRAKGIDNRPIITKHEAKSISQEVTFPEDLNDKVIIAKTLARLSKNLGKRLRKSNRAATTLKIKIRWPDFTTISRQVSFEEPIEYDSEILSAASYLLDREWNQSIKIRLIGIGVSGLCTPRNQLKLWRTDDIESTKFIKEQKLQEAVRAITIKYGEKILLHGDEFNRQNDTQDE